MFSIRSHAMSSAAVLALLRAVGAPIQYGRGRKVNRRPASTLSQVHAGGEPSRQVLRSEARAADKKGYREQREHMRWVRKQERLVAHAG